MRAAEAVGDLLAGKKTSPQELIRRLKDPNELVRVEAADSLRAIGDRRALAALWRAVHDRSSLVRRYVLETIGELGSSTDIPRVERLLRGERSANARLGCYVALYQLGRRDVMPQLVALLQNRDYRIRCAAANTLGRLARRSNAAMIVKVLQLTLRQESTVAARSSLRTSIRAIRRRWGAAGVKGPPVA